MTLFLQSYLFAFLFWLSIALGSLALLAIHGLTGGRWGEAIRVPLLAAIGTLPALGLLFLPVLLGVNLLFPWTGGGAEAKAAYLNVPFFAVRAAIYFLCWIAIGFFAVRSRAIRYPAPALLLYVVTMTFASWDWMMSLEPKWWSTIYAMNVLAGQALTALAAIIFFAAYFRREALQDLGNLLLSALMFWAYLTFSQFLIIWSGNGKDEISWYLSRIDTSWRWAAVALVVFAFFAPFIALLFRSAKRSAKVSAWIAGLILLTRVLELFWTIVPAFRPDGFAVRWTDVVAFAIVGTIWIAVFRRQLSPVSAASPQRV